MAKLTAQQFADKHNRRTKAAIEDMKKGVENVTESPMLKAAAKADKMKQRLVESIDNGKWQAGLKRVSLEEWKDKMINLGIPRLSAGLDANKKKVEAFAEELLPFIDSAKQSISSMPDVTLEDSINRMSAWTRKMATFRRKG